MPRLMPTARSPGNHYRNFAIGVMAVAAIMAVASDGSSGEALVPPPASRTVDEERAPASLAPPAGETTWATGTEEAEPAPDAATPPESDEDAAEARPAGPPKPGKRGPADRPTPEQLTMLIAASRERSGAPAEGD